MALRISRILHAGYVFEYGATRILFDPIFESPFSGNCYAFPQVTFDREQIRSLKISAVFLSHFHDDHCSFESLDLLDRQTPIFVYCLFAELFDLIRELGFVDVRPLAFDATVRIDEFAITPRRALDADVDAMFQIRLGDINVLNVVDSMMDPETLAVLQNWAPWDLVLWPFQALRETAVIAPSRFPAERVEIPEDWITELRALAPRYVVPSSCQFVHEPWSWYNHALFSISYQQFAHALQSALPNTQVVRMNPSAAFALDKNVMEPVTPLSWVVPEGGQDVDYVYLPEVTPPATVDIAARFPPLESEHRRKVQRFCQDELPRVYGELEKTAYFSQPRLWRLSVFDHAGTESQFLYRVENGSMVLEAASLEPVAWTTEVPIAKLFAALESGETLTSMYVRVNNGIFAREIESELTEMDVLEDPLIRSLFNGRFGSYQREQLKRLKARSLCKETDK